MRSGTSKKRKFTGDIVAIAATKHYTTAAAAWTVSKQGMKFLGATLGAVTVILTFVASALMPTSMPTATADNPVPSSLRDEVKSSSNGELSDSEIDAIAEEMFVRQQQRGLLASPSSPETGHVETLASGSDVQIVAQAQFTSRFNRGMAKCSDWEGHNAEEGNWFTRAIKRGNNFFVDGVSGLCENVLFFQGKGDDNEARRTSEKLIEKVTGGKVEDIDSPAQFFSDSMSSKTLMAAAQDYTTFLRFDASSASASADLGFGKSAVYQAVMVPFKWLQQVFFLIAGFVAMVFGMFVTMVASVDVMGRLIYTSDEIYYQVTSLIFGGAEGTKGLLGVALSVLVFSAVISLGLGAFRAGSGMMNRVGGAAGMSMSPISLIGTAIFGTLALYVTMSQAGKNHPRISGVPVESASPIGRANMSAKEYLKSASGSGGIMGTGSEVTQEDIERLLGQANPGVAQSAVGDLVKSDTRSTSDPWAWAPLSPGFFYGVVSQVGYAFADIISSVFVVLSEAVSGASAVETQCDMYVNAMHTLFLETEAAKGNVRGASMVVSYDKLVSDIHYRNYAIATFSQKSPEESSGAAWCRSAEIQSSNSPQSQIVILRAAQLMGGPFGFGTQMSGTDKELPIYNGIMDSEKVDVAAASDGDLVTSDGRWVQRGNEKEDEESFSNSGYRAYTAAKAFLGPEYFMNKGSEKINYQRGGMLALTYFGACQWIPGKPHPYLHPKWAAVRRGSDGSFDDAKSMLGAFPPGTPGDTGGVCTYGFGNTGGGEGGSDNDKAYAFAPKAENWSTKYAGGGGSGEEDEGESDGEDGEKLVVEGVTEETVRNSLEDNALPEEGIIPIWGVGFGSNTTQSNTWNYYPAGESIPIVTPLLGFALDKESGISQFSDAPEAKAYMESIHYGVSNIGVGMVVALIDTVAMVMVARYFGAILVGTVVAGIIGGLAIGLLGLVGIFLMLPIQTLRRTGKMIIRTIISAIITVSLVSSMFMLAFALVRLMNNLFFIPSLTGFTNAVLHAIGVLIALIATNKLIKLLFNVDTSSVNSAVQTMNSAAAPVLQATGLDKIRGPLDRSWWKGTNGQDKSFAKMLTGKEITNPSGAKQLLAKATRRTPAGAAAGGVKAANWTKRKTGEKYDNALNKRGQKAYDKAIDRGETDEQAELRMAAARAPGEFVRDAASKTGRLAAWPIKGAGRLASGAYRGAQRGAQAIAAGYAGSRLNNFMHTGNFGRGDAMLDSRLRNKDIREAAAAEMEAMRVRDEDFDTLLDNTGGLLSYRDAETGQIGLYDTSKFTGTPEERNLIANAYDQMMTNDSTGQQLHATAIQARNERDRGGDAFSRFIEEQGIADGNRAIASSMGMAGKDVDAVDRAGDGASAEEILTNNRRESDRELEQSLDTQRGEHTPNEPPRSVDRDAHSRVDYGEDTQFQFDNYGEAERSATGYGPEPQGEADPQTQPERPQPQTQPQPERPQPQRPESIPDVEPTTDSSNWDPRDWDEEEDYPALSSQSRRYRDGGAPSPQPAPQPRSSTRTPMPDGPQPSRVNPGGSGRGGRQGTPVPDGARERGRSEGRSGGSTRAMSGAAGRARKAAAGIFGGGRRGGNK